jgi:hypothetical protein
MGARKKVFIASSACSYCYPLSFFAKENQGMTFVAITAKIARRCN